MPEEPEVPGRQFVFEDARMEQRKNGELLWTARAKRTDGDLGGATAFTITMRREPEGAAKESYDIVSPKAELDFSGGKADFADVRITDESGGVLTAGEAHYEEKAARIDVSGPIAFSAKGLVANATKGAFDLEQGRLDIEGPVQGRFNAEAMPTSAPPAPRPP